MSRTRIGALADRIAEARKWRQTRRAVEGLPDRLLTDIGLARTARGKVIRLADGFK